MQWIVEFGRGAKHMAGKWTAVACLAAAAWMTVACGSPTPAESGTKPVTLRGYIDVPKPGQNINGKFVAIGWAISEDGIKRISASLDGKFLMNCSYGGNRPDVNKLVPGFPSGDNAGWSCVIDTAAWAEGPHQIAFESESNKGEIRNLGAVPVQIVH